VIIFGHAKVYEKGDLVVEGCTICLSVRLSVCLAVCLCLSLWLPTL